MGPGADPRRRPVIWNAIGPRVARLARHLDRWIGWDRLPYPLGLLALMGLRHGMREQNLYDPDRLGASSAGAQDIATAQTDATRRAEAIAQRHRTRALDGSWTHPLHATMGAVGARFGRNLPVRVEARSSAPDPAAVSEALLQRSEFVAAESLNMLAAAWLQFEVHDWFAHKINQEAELPTGVGALMADPEYKGTVPLFSSEQTHWWDASQLYGVQVGFAETIRTEDSATTGKVKVDDPLLEAMEEYEPPIGSLSDPAPNFWVGLGLFHIVFAHEHNAICERLEDVYPWWSGDRIFDQARMINAAVMAKIHTVEWTPALLAHPTTARSIRSAWWGVLGERVRKRFGRIGTGEILSGIPGSWMDDDVAFSLTEEFAAIYRMHPLLPPTITFRSAADHRPLSRDGGATIAFERLVDVPGEPGSVTRELLDDIGIANAWYSLAVANPGAMTLHNHPTFRPLASTGTPVDLGAVDIARTRECGIPRYNEFRRSLRMPAARTFLQLADDNAQFAEQIRRAYDNKIEDVDLVVGLLVDRKPKGFAISDTAFRIFLLMAARRLRSDRFFTLDYTPEVYTPLGLEWIEDASMADILRRHVPELRRPLDGVENVFRPWWAMPGPAV